MSLRCFVWGALAACAASCAQLAEDPSDRVHHVPVSKAAYSAPADPPYDPAAPPAVRAPAEARPTAPPPVASTQPAEAPQTQAVAERQVVAASLLQVNRHFFSIDDIVQLAEPQVARLPRGLPPAAARRRVVEIIATILRDQVNRTLVLDEAEKRLPDEVRQGIDAKVEERMKELVARAGGSALLLEQKLKAEGTTLDSVKETYRDDLRIRAYLQEKFAADLVVNRRVLREYYNSHRSEFVTPKRVQMQIIAAPLDAFGPATAAGDKAAARPKALEAIRAARQAVQAGKDFGEVARAMSKDPKAPEGGLWPLMPAGSFRQTEVEKAAFALAEGQVSDVIETDAGFFLVKAKRVVPEKVAGFEEAQGSIEDRLHNEQYLRLLAACLQEINEKATVVRNDDLFFHAVEQAVAKYLAQTEPK